MSIPRPTPPPETAGEPAAVPSFIEALRFWLKLGCISFGGPTGQIAIMHAELVEKRRWISEDRFLHALNFCMLLPGPEAQQLATYCGWLLHRTWGGIAAGALFVLPSVFVLWLLSFAYVTWGGVPWLAGALHGLKPAVLAIVASAALRIGRRTLRHPVHGLITAAAFAAIVGLRTPFPLIIAGAALVGWLGHRLGLPGFATPAKDSDHAPASAQPGTTDSSSAGAHADLSWRRAARVLATGLTLWWAPVLLAGAWLGWDSTLFKQGVFFSKAALVTFGGAYAVLPYVAQEAVQEFGWLSASQMLDGLAFAETTPGPLIMVLQHVGFVGGWNHPGALSGLTAATLGAALTTWTTFLPCFLWIFLGAPHIERLRRHTGLSAALAGVTAAVVGVILNLVVWFGWHVIHPDADRIDGFVLVVAVAVFAALYRRKLDVAYVIAGAASVGMLWAHVT